ncbi:MAG: hypothetical protein ABJA80_04775, partial [bacterium]
MKALRMAALGAALVVGGSMSVMAQGGAPGTMQQGGGRGGRPNMQMKDITLSAEQQAKVDEINKKYSPEMQEIRDAMQAGGDRAASMKKMGELRAKMAPEIRAVLTADQQVVFDKNAAD